MHIGDFVPRHLSSDRLAAARQRSKPDKKQGRQGWSYSLQGSITVFLSLVLTLVIALVGVSLESARSSGMHMRLRLAADASLESVFAEYDDALWGTFHLLFRSAGDRSGETLGNRMLTYAKEGLGDSENLFGGYPDWFTLEASSAEISDIVYVTDQNGAVFEDAVLDYMKGGIIRILLEEMIARLGVFNDEDAKEKLDESGKKGEFSFNSIYSDYEELKEKAEEEHRKEEEARLKEEEARQGEGGNADGGEAGASPPSSQDGEGNTAADGSQASGGNGDSSEEPGISMDDILKTVKNLMRHGFMGIVVNDPNGLSHKAVSGVGFPSHLSQSAKSRRSAMTPVSASGSSGNLKNRLLVDEYLLRFLDCYTSEDDPDEEEDNDTPEFQVEYVIAGKNADYDNLKTVVNRLLWFREALNMAYLLADAQKSEEITMLATALITPTGQLYLIPPAAGLLTAAWAFAESLRDVKALLAGGRVPFLKDGQSWKTSLENIASDIASASSVREEDELPTGKGLTYVDYLRVLLAFVNPESRNYRAMDMIQVSMRKIRPDFDMTECIYSCSATLTATGPYRFLVFSQLLPHGKEGGYNISCKTWYGYKQRQGD